jgi:hypothetical protein
LSAGTTLAKLVADQVHLSGGQFFVDLSQIIDWIDLDFGSGNLPLSRKEGLGFARLIKSFISDQTCVTLLQETQMKASELVGFEYAKLALRYDGEIYWRMAGPELATLSDDEIFKIVNSASFYPFAAFFFTAEPRSEGTMLTLDDLNDVAAGIVGIAVGAFDDRSFLIWWRDDCRPLALSSL